MIASTMLRDTEPPFTCLLMLLRPNPPYYEVAEYMWMPYTETWAASWRQSFPNINPATDHFADCGGDY